MAKVFAIGPGMNAEQITALARVAGYGDTIVCRSGVQLAMLHLLVNGARDVNVNLINSADLADKIIHNANPADKEKWLKELEGGHANH